MDFICSLDGYGAAEGWPGWWGLEGPEHLAGDALELGSSRTFDGRSQLLEDVPTLLA